MKLQKPLRPFFKYYGSKWSLAKHYKKPKSETIIEPFAGSACYSLHHWNRYEVWLNDLDDNIASLWSYLIKVKESEIKSLPLLKQGQSVDDLDVCKEAKILMGFWLGFACSTPRKTESPTSAREQAKNPTQCLSWADPAKWRIIDQLPKIRHWKVTNLSYSALPDIEATWFIDPPYADKGYKYRESEIDYPHLAEWCGKRKGQYIVCENAGATWMKFNPFRQMRNQDQQVRKEVAIQKGW